MQKLDLKSIFITGASSGIGAALAERYAAPGVTLGLAARRVEKLKAVADRCETKGATVYRYRVDVADGPAVATAAADFVRHTGRIDLVIANAGLGGWRHPQHDSAEQLTAVVNTNVNGVINTVMAFVPTMIKQRNGHIVAMSSIAAFAPLPRGAYSASKIAVRYLMDGWRSDLGEFGIRATTIFPGFVASEMTARPDVPYLILVSAEQAAAAMARAINQGRRNFIYPWPWRVIARLAPIIPAWFWRRVLPAEV